MDANTLANAVRVVSTQSEFEAAYTELKNGLGGTILLESTQAYNLDFQDREGYVDAPVTIRSANPDDPAEITYMKLRGAENLTVENVHFHRPNVGSTFDDMAISLTHSTNILIRDSLITSDGFEPLGTTAGDNKSARGALVRDSTGVTFEGNTFKNLNHGVIFMDSYDGAVINNEITGLQGDGIRLAGITGMLVEGNHVHDFVGSTQAANHADFIQLWGVNIKVNNADITIRENFLDTGSGPSYQMIFGYNNAFSKNGFTFTNIVVEDNVLLSAHVNAISLANTDQVIVRHNTLLPNTEAYNIEPDGSRPLSEMDNRITIGGTNVTIENNIAARVNGGTNNVELTSDSAFRDDDFRAHFLNIEAAGSGDLRDLMLRPDSPLNGTMGSRLLWSTDTADSVTAVVDVTVSALDRSVVVLDASLSRGPNGYVAADGATFIWVFDNGHTVAGATITHDFGPAGPHNYELIVTMPDGTTDQISRTITIDDPVALDLTAQGGTLTDVIANSDVVSLANGATVANGWIDIGSSRYVQVHRDEDTLHDLPAFNIGLTAQTAPGKKGFLVDLRQVFQAEIGESGYLNLTLKTDEGTFKLTSATALFADAGAHRLNMVYDGVAQTLSLVVDGVVDASVMASGLTPPKAAWGLTLGTARTNRSVDAEIRDIYILSEAAPLDDVRTVSSTPAPPDVLGELSADTALDGTATLAFDISDNTMLSPAGFDIGPGVLALSNGSAQVFDTDMFQLNFDMTLPDASTTGTVLFLHDTIEMVFDDFGRLVLRLVTDQGTKQIATDILNLQDGQSYEIGVGYDGPTARLQIHVDGVVAAEGIHTGMTAPQGVWDLHFGHPQEPQETPEMVVDNIVVMENLAFAAPADASTGTIGSGPVLASGETILALDFDGVEVMDASGAGAYVSRRGAEVDLVADDTGDPGQVVQLGDRSAVQVSSDYDAVFGLDSFAFNFDMRSDTSDGRKVFGIHQAYSLDVVGDDLWFRFGTTEGDYVLKSSGDLLGDRDWHNVTIAYSDALQLLQMQVDGAVVAESQASGVTPDKSYWGLDLGRHWSDGFNGAVDDFVLLTNIGADHFDFG